MARAENEPGKGAFWMIDPQYAHMFSQDGNFTSGTQQKRRPTRGGACLPVHFPLQTQSSCTDTSLSFLDNSPPSSSRNDDGEPGTPTEPERKRARMSSDMLSSHQETATKIEGSEPPADSEAAQDNGGQDDGSGKEEEGEGAI